MGRFSIPEREGRVVLLCAMGHLLGARPGLRAGCLESSVLDD